MVFVDTDLALGRIGAISSLRGPGPEAVTCGRRPRPSRDLLGRFTRIAVTNMLLALILKFGSNMTLESESCVFTALAEGRDS